MVDLSHISQDLQPLAKPVDEMRLDDKNARHGHDLPGIAESLKIYGQRVPLVVNVNQGHLIEKGNGTYRAATEILGWEYIAAIYVNDSASTATGFGIADNRLTDLSSFDTQMLPTLLAEIKNDLTTLPTGYSEDDALAIIRAFENEKLKPPPPIDDQIENMQAKWGTCQGQIWLIPSRDSNHEHRLICGDSTDPDTIALLMAADLATLCHADPPYGMGKENQGVLNDNLYNNKLDTFQLTWWAAIRPFLTDNASAYIWGNAEDLWRLWYSAGLDQSERLSLRNEIVWNKGTAGAGGISHQGAQGIRLYPNSTERCLFFMLGEQGFSTNADNYWAGFESIRIYLKEQRDQVGWTIGQCKEIAGHSQTSGCHWFDKSQWTMPTREVYESWQKAAASDAFKKDYDAFKKDYDALKKDYDALKGDWLALRAYFNNSHDNMTDVWSFGRVVGKDRYNHPTPKPVDMIERIIKSSTRPNEIIISPFLGSGSDLIASELNGRQCRACELSPKWLAVSLQRYQDTFGITPTLWESSPNPLIE